MLRTILRLCIGVIFCFSPSAFAQSRSSVGAYVGKVIPSGPDGITEIFGVGGLRYSTQGSGRSQTDMGATFGAAGPVLWQDLFINTRFNMENYGFRNHIGVGLDLLRYRTAVEQTDELDMLIVDADGNPILRELTKTTLGLHIIGGLTTELLGPINLRADGKLNITPDLILTLTIGLEWPFGEAADSTK